MNSLFLIAVVIGIVYQLFIRKSPLEKRNRMPDFGGGQQRRPGSPPQRGVPMRIPSAKREQPRPSPQPIYAEQRAEEQVVVPAPSMTARSKLPEATPTEPAFAKAQPAESLSRDELARAVMWAEILGPPRARRPHRR